MQFLERLHGRKVLELGAGAALPSLVAMAQDEEVAPELVVVSDFNDPELVENINENLLKNSELLLDRFRPGHTASCCCVAGYAWGTNTEVLLERAHDGFDVVLLGDCMWNAGEHESLLKTLCGVLRKEPHQSLFKME